MWKCIRCEKENQDSEEMCAACGHERAMDYSEVQSMRRVHKITSESYYGLSKIQVELDPATPAAEIPQLWDELRRKIMNVQPALPHTYFQEAIQIFHIASYYCHFRVGTVGWIPEQDMTAQMETNLAFFDRVVHLMLYGLLPRETHPQETPFICN